MFDEDRYYDRAGNPISVFVFARLFRDKDYQQFHTTTLRDGTVISTIWLGLDHRYHWGENTPPLIFETAVFPASSWASGVLDEQEMYRYPTEASAVAHHDQLVAKYNEAYDRLQATLNEVEVEVEVEVDDA